MNIVTGYTGTPHVTSNEAQALNQGVFGSGNVVLNVGNKFAATLVDANTITIQDGEGIMQGVQFRIAPGETETVTIENGTIGYNRIDLICARYTKNAQTGVEAVNLVVVEGTPTASTPSVPSVSTGNILEGDSPVDFPLYSVIISELVPYVSPRFGYACTVVETSIPSGISNGWNYRKFSDGTYEAWQTKHITTNITTQSSGVYISTSEIPINAPSFSTSVSYGLANIVSNIDEILFILQVEPYQNTLRILMGAHASKSSATCELAIRIEGEWS